MRPRRMAVGSLLAALAASMLVVIAPHSAVALAPVNPVTVPINGHPANSGFGVFVEGNVRLANDESESTIAVGGDLTLVKNYQIAAGATPVPTFTAPGDARQTYLYVRGGVTWGPGSFAVNVENQGFTKIADTSTYDAFNRDNNNALVNYRIVPKGQPYNSSRFIDGRTNQQTPASIGTPVPTNLIDMDAAFAKYRTLTQQMADCPTSVLLRDTQGTPLPRPITPGASGRLTLTTGQTNVLTLTGDELDNLSEITFTNPPTASTPLLVNVVGNFSGTTPNLAGVSGNQAPFMLWNFATASSVLVTGGATIEGTIYAPNATVVWAPTQNIEGNVIAASFSHGPLARGRSLREIHKFPFDTTLSCASSARLTLVKKVVNDDGGTAAPTAWNLSASGPTNISGTTGSAAITGATVTPGQYDLAESGGPSGYATGPWRCDGGTQVGGRLTLADGDDVTCTITNNDIPVQPPPEAQLTLVKQVINDDGGTAADTDWTLSATGATTIFGRTGDPRSPTRPYPRATTPWVRAAAHPGTTRATGTAAAARSRARP